MTPAERREALFAQLAAMPVHLQQLVPGVGDEVARSPGPGGSFSLVEQAWHLADLEREGYGERIARLLDEDDPFLADFDGARIARERDYRSRSLAQGVSAFAAARAENLSILRGLDKAAWKRSGQQEGVGRITLEDVPRMMCEHDATHRAEIEALLGETERAPSRSGPGRPSTPA